MTKVAHIINCRNKGPYVYRTVAAALAQVYPCEIVVADFASTDNSRAEIERAIADAPRNAEHEVKFLECNWQTKTSMFEMNKNVDWLWRQTSPECEWIFQSSADDYSLPARVSVCMAAVEKNPCSSVATTMYFEEPDKPSRESVSGYPQQTGYVKAGEGLMNLAYGSTIGGYARDFLERVGSAGPNTPDVYWGLLSAIDRGFYVVANPQHVHSMVADVNNTGFQGKMRGASGDDSLKLAAMNHEQLLRLYLACWDAGLKFTKGKMPDEAVNALANMVLGQSKGLMDAREELRRKGIPQCVLELP